MDHLDWAEHFDAEKTPAPTASNLDGYGDVAVSWVDAETFDLWRVLKDGGIVFWRCVSAGNRCLRFPLTREL